MSVVRPTEQAGVNREWVLVWTIVPRYLGDGNRIWPVRPAEVVEGRGHLRDLVKLRQDLWVVRLGQPAAQGWGPLATEFPRVTMRLTWHSSGQVLNSHPARRAHGLAQAVAVHAFEDTQPGWTDAWRTGNELEPGSGVFMA